MGAHVSSPVSVGGLYCGEFWFTILIPIPLLVRVDRRRDRELFSRSIEPIYPETVGTEFSAAYAEVGYSTTNFNGCVGMMLYRRP